MKTLLGIAHLAISIYAILHILKSNAEDLHKVLWTLFVLFFPVVGLVVWYVTGPKSNQKLL